MLIGPKSIPLNGLRQVEVYPDLRNAPKEILFGVDRIRFRKDQIAASLLLKSATGAYAASANAGE